LAVVVGVGDAAGQHLQQHAAERFARFAGLAVEHDFARAVGQ